MSKTLDSREFLPTFIRLVNDLAVKLNGTATRLPDLDNSGYARIKTADVDMSFYLDCYRGHLTISLSWPQYRNEHGSLEFPYISDLSYDKINVNPTKGADKIAADITRRFLPTAKVAYATALERCRDSQKYVNGKFAVMTDLAKHFGVEIRQNSPETLYLKGNLPTLRVNSATSVDFLNFSCTPELAKKLVALIQQETKGSED